MRWVVERKKLDDFPGSCRPKARLAALGYMGRQLGLRPTTPPVMPDAAAAGGIEVPVSPGPDAADIAAASEMSTEDRDAMIAGMVDGLAARLEDNPEDGPGWQRLARAYDVLGRTEAAQDALVSAADALIADADAQLAALQAIVAGNAEDRLVDDADRLLARLVQYEQQHTACRDI